MVEGWEMAREAVTSLESGNVWCVVLKDVGPPVLALADVLNVVGPSLRLMVAAHWRMSLRWSLAVFPSSRLKVATLLPLVLRWSLVWCVVHWARLPLPEVRESLQQADCLGLVRAPGPIPLSAPLPGAGVDFRDSSPCPLPSPPLRARQKKVAMTFLVDLAVSFWVVELLLV